jgi:CheY-like chemotaxis protein
MNDVWTSTLLAPVAPVSDAREAAHVLIVKDGPARHLTVAYALTRDGFRVHVVASGEGAFDVVRSARDHTVVIVLDTMFPGMSGLQELRSLPRATRTPVRMLSARDKEQGCIAGLDPGAHDDIVKPFALQELVALVRAGASRRFTPPAQRLRALRRNSLQVEIGRRCVVVGAEELCCGPGKPDCWRRWPGSLAASFTANPCWTPVGVKTCSRMSGLSMSMSSACAAR